jgi:hypothetical protein
MRRSQVLSWALMRTKAAWVAALTALCAACFADAPMVGGATTGDACSMGARGCSCYPNETCDEELECHLESALCVPQGCTPGTHHCGCLDGSCVDPWACIGGLCLDEDAGGTSSASATDTGDDAGVTSVAGTSTDGTTDDGTETSADSTTGQVDSCASMTDCNMCLSCASQGGPCTQALADCMAVGERCMDVAQCQASCAFYFDCNTECCGDDDSAVVLADAYTACRVETCSVPCRANLEYPVCSP